MDATENVTIDSKYPQRLLNLILKKEELPIDCWCCCRAAKFFLGGNERQDSDENADYGKLLYLLLNEKDMPMEIQTSINERAERYFTGPLENEVREFLAVHLGIYDGCSEDAVRTLIQCVPEALSRSKRRLDRGTWFRRMPTITYLPFDKETISFIPLLAEEGLKHDVGGEGMRGGLLCGGRDNTLQNLASHYDSEGDDQDDMRRVDVMRRLRDMGLMKKEDIQEYRLLENASCRNLDRRNACKNLSKRRFEFLVEWDPDALMRSFPRQKDFPLLYKTIISKKAIGRFEMVLKAGIRYFPHQLGLLFHKDRNIELAYDFAYKKFGAIAAWTAIKGCFDDEHHQLEIDPETNLHPFMIAATKGSESKNLDLIYYLLQKDLGAVLNIADVLGRSASDDSNGGPMRKRKR
jgi:hypothetical protein